MFDTSTVEWYEASETVTITRYVPGASFPFTASTITVYSGPADFQDDGASAFYNPSGMVDEVHAHIVIDPAADGTLPSVQLDDDVAIAGVNGGQPYGKVTQATVWNKAPTHLYVQVKRGPISDAQRL